MNLFALIKKSISTVFTNPSMVLFLILFLIISNFISSYVSTSTRPAIVLIMTLCVLLLTFCFFAGWFNVIKDIVLDEEKQDKNYFPIFFEGVGKNVVTIGIASLIYSGILLVMLFVTGKIAMHFFGNLDFVFKDLVTISQSNTAFMEYFNKLSLDQKYALYGWQISFIMVGIIFNFLMFFYFPAVTFEQKGNVFQKPFIALISSFKFLFKNFFPILALYLFVYLIYFALGIAKTFFANNFIISILMLFVYIGFICSVIMIIFNYYGHKQQDNCDNGCNCIRQDENIDKSSEEN